MGSDGMRPLYTSDITILKSGWIVAIGRTRGDFEVDMVG